MHLYLQAVQHDGINLKEIPYYNLHTELNLQFSINYFLFMYLLTTQI